MSSSLRTIFPTYMANLALHSSILGTVLRVVLVSGVSLAFEMIGELTAIVLLVMYLK
jgi:hypothetical protein